ncbi:MULTISPECIES: S-layer homology domain-containing protein [unclassified Oscillibacter]|uniref:S-layer homology domain-containing protein n=1 Tax=unclassified Oscillibacter TaxID=2629304 RepID=UPI0025F3395A|nr:MULTISPECIES: S-layer homology domain-containing protein [unclassified Oscillibacter]
MKIKRKKIMSAVLSAVMALSLLPSAALAAELNDADSAKQIVSAQTSGAQLESYLTTASQGTSDFAGGAGTVDDPYQIETAGQLAMVAENLGASYKLVANITLTGTWTPIGTFQASAENGEEPDEAYAFHGTFDGNGKTITGLNIGGENAMCVGLFGVTANATVKDLTLENATVAGFTMTAAAIGYAYNTTVDNVDLTGTNTIHGWSTGANIANMVAGIVGAGMDSTILNCDVSGTALTMDGISGATVSGANVHDAGLVAGGLEGCTLERCTVNSGSVEVTTAGGFAFGIGGLAGCSIEAAYVKDCSATDVAVRIADGKADLIGGLMGYSGTSGLAAPTQITDCAVAGSAIYTIASSTRVGGLLGGGFYFDAFAAYYPVPARISVTNSTADAGSYKLVGWITDLDSVEGAAADQYIFAGGDGSTNTPHEISSAAALYAVNYGLNANYKLTADIDLSSFNFSSQGKNYHLWQPIGVLRYGTDVNMTTGAMDLTKAFSGTFDGGNFTISNVTVDASADETMMAPGGIFSCVTGTVKNLTVKNVSVAANENAAMTAGGVIGYALPGAVLSNVDLTADGQRNTVTGRNCVGGITGGSESAALSGCDVSKTDIVVLGSNDFSKTPGRIIQVDVAECGGPVVGGGFGGSITNSSATNCTVSAAGNEPVGLGGLAGCLQCMTDITGNTVTKVTISTQKGGHAIGGLCGYAGTGNDGRDDKNITAEPLTPTAVTGNTVDITINAPGATHVGGLIGTGLYFYGMEDRYTASNNTVSGSIIAGTGADSVYGATTPGAIAGRAVGSSIDESNTFSGLTINNAAAVNAVGTTNGMYESGDQYGEDDTAAFIQGISDTYQQLFEGATFLPKCDAYWHDFSAAVVGADKADEMVAMMKASIGAAEGQQGEGAFFCGFMGDVATLTFNGLQISGYDAQGVRLFSRPYRYVGTEALYMDGKAVMSGFTVLQSLDADSGDYTYFLMAPDTPEETYHIEFRYGSDLNALKQFASGSYANWLAAGIPTSAMEETTGTKGQIDNALRQVIALFCTENLSEGVTAQTAAQRSDLVGIWDANAATLALLEAATGLSNVRMYCELKADGTGATYLDMGTGSYTKTADYTFYAYDNDGSASTFSGVYIAATEGGTTSTSPYTIVTDGTGKTLSFYAEDGTAAYVKRGSVPTNNSGSDSGDGGSVSSGNTNISASGGSVTAAQMTAAVKSAAKGAAISVSAASTSQVTLPVSGLTAAQANNNSLNITTKNGVIAVSAEALAGVISGASSSAVVSVGITTASASAAGLSDGTPAFDVSLSVGGQAVHSFDGTLTITLTVANLSKIANPYVLHILADGTKEYLKPSVSGNSLTISGVRNLSVFAVIPSSEVPAELAFTDVASGAYYADAVRWAVEKGVTSGTSATTFGPNAACTRAQAVTFLWRAAGSPKPASTANPFGDVDSGAYYFKAVLWALEKGITGGTSATVFNPNGAVTRAQIVTFQYRAAGSPPVTTANSFGDVPSGAYYANAILWAVEKSVTNGTTATTFSPNTNCTRGQIVTFLYRQFGV